MKFLTSNGVIRLWKNFLARLKARCIEYDNSYSQLDGATVQEAIDEIANKFDTRMGNCYLKYENGKYYIGHEVEETEVEV